MQTTTLSFSNIHNHGELFANLFRARRQCFIVKNNWDLPESEGMEFDQYDTPQSRWVAIHDRGDILAGIRLTPTTARCGIYSYMIRDAQLKILGGDIPSDLLYDEAPVDPQVWESSRVFVAESVPMNMRRTVHAALIGEMARSARECGASRLIGMISSVWPRWKNRYGLEIDAIGRKMRFADGEFQCVSINLASKLH